MQIGGLLTAVLFTAVRNLAIGVDLGTAFIEEHDIVTLLDEQKTAVWK